MSRRCTAVRSAPVIQPTHQGYSWRGGIILVTADLINDTCGFAVPFKDYDGERTLHSDFFGRKTDEQFAAYCAQAQRWGALVVLALGPVCRWRPGKAGLGRLYHPAAGG